MFTHYLHTHTIYDKKDPLAGQTWRCYGKQVAVQDLSVFLSERIIKNPPEAVNDVCLYSRCCVVGISYMIISSSFGDLWLIYEI